MRSYFGYLLVLVLLLPLSARAQHTLIDRLTVEVYARTYTPDFEHLGQWAHASRPSVPPSVRSQTLQRLSGGTRVGFQITNRWTISLSYALSQGRSVDVATTPQGDLSQTGMIRLETSPLLAGIQYRLAPDEWPVHPYLTAEAGLLFSRVEGYDRVSFNGVSQGAGALGQSYEDRDNQFAARPSIGLKTSLNWPVQFFAEMGYLFGRVDVENQLANSITRNPVETSANDWDLRLGLHLNL